MHGSQPGSVNFFLMYNILRKYIDRVTSSVIPDEEFAYIEQAFEVKQVKRKQFLLHEGNVCRYMSFIVSGAMRQYSVDDAGNEKIAALAVEGWWISDRGSFINVTPSRYNIDAVEDSTVLVTTLEKINLLKNQSLTFLRMAHNLDQNHALAAQKRIEAGISYTAEEKYNYLLQAHPEFFNRFTQNMLASYLGLTPETMSRVRKAMSSR